MNDPEETGGENSDLQGEENPAQGEVVRLGDYVEVLWLDAWLLPGRFEAQDFDPDYPRITVGVVCHLTDRSITVASDWLAIDEAYETYGTIPLSLVRGVRVLGRRDA